jgi:ABC-type polysaccharide/polyol phosphate transport system ATPase subunit
MQVRLAFTVAISANKEILLLDEVLAVGDASFQAKCHKVFADLIKAGKTIIFVSHSSSSIQQYSNRVLYLESGKKAFIGDPGEALKLYLK